MRNILIRRSLVCGIVILFLGLCITSGTGVNIEKTSNQLAPAISPMMAGELAWWKLDEGSGTTAYDSSGNSYDGTIVGATWGSGGLSFDGTNDYVDLDDHAQYDLGLSKTDDYVVSAWFKSSSSGMIYSMSHTNPARPYFDLALASNGAINVQMGDESCLFELSSDSGYNDGSWHSVLIKFYGDMTDPTLEIYVDGSLEGSLTDWLCPMLDEDFLTAKLGRNSNTEEDYYNGILSDVRIYKNSDPGKRPSNPVITGEDDGNAGTPYTYTFTSSDPDGDTISYYIKWGDGDTTSWTSASSSPYQEDHTYESGTFTIEAQAKDNTGLTSWWGTYQVTMPRNIVFNFNQLFLRFLEAHPNAFPMLRYILGL